MCFTARVNKRPVLLKQPNLLRSQPTKTILPPKVTNFETVLLKNDASSKVSSSPVISDEKNFKDDCDWNIEIGNFSPDSEFTDQETVVSLACPKKLLIASGPGGSKLIDPSQIGIDEGKNKPKRRRKPQKPGLTAKGDERHFVQHNYHDHSQDREEDYKTNANNIIGPNAHKCRRGSMSSFPLKLHAMLDQIENDGLAHVISWIPHGRAFAVHKPKAFVEYVMPTYFRQTKLTSFQRQLNLYGFARLTRGNDNGAYYHELFLRGMPFLTQGMVRKKIKGTGFKAASSPESEPDFYSMAPVNVPSNSPQADFSSSLAPVVDQSNHLSKTEEFKETTIYNMKIDDVEIRSAEKLSLPTPAQPSPQFIPYVPNLDLCTSSTNNTQPLNQFAASALPVFSIGPQPTFFFGNYFPSQAPQLSSFNMDPAIAAVPYTYQVPISCHGSLEPQSSTPAAPNLSWPSLMPTSSQSLDLNNLLSTSRDTQISYNYPPSVISSSDISHPSSASVSSLESWDEDDLISRASFDNDSDPVLDSVVEEVLCGNSDPNEQTFMVDFINNWADDGLMDENDMPGSCIEVHNGSFIETFEDDSSLALLLEEMLE